MKSFGVMTNSNKDKNYHCTQQLVPLLIDNQCKVYMEKKHLEASDLYIPQHYKSKIIFCETPKEVMQESDIIISLGGDGTFLKAARKNFGINKPIVGINLGNLGFLAEIDGCNFEPAIEKIINNDFFIEKRMIIEIEIKRDNKVIAKDYALNDAVLTSNSPRKMIHVNTYINDVFLDYIPGDGVIVSTPTGSTAYNLSAGGPLMEPDLNTMLVTPICPHNLYSRGCIISPERTIKISLHKDFKPEGVFTIDGKNTFNITKEDSIFIKKADFYVNAIKINKESFFKTLRKKIYNRYEKKKEN